MIVKASLKHFRMSARKVRLVADLIRGMDIERAKIQLKFLPKKAADVILKLLNSAVANAENNLKLQKDNLYISKILVDSGPILKRWLPRAHGRATPIRKRTSHITIILDEKEPSKAKAKPEKKTAEKPELAEVKKEEIKPELDLDKSFVAEEEKKKEETRKGWQETQRPEAEKRGFDKAINKIFRRKSF